MADVRTRASQRRDEEPACTDTMEQHAARIGAAFEADGIGGGCEGTYQALVELAEVLRLIHNFPVYQPTEYAQKQAAKALKYRASKES